MQRDLVRPFRALLFNREKVGDISLCICPPYDVVTGLRRYYEKSPYNIIRLELPISTPFMNKYANAYVILNSWLNEGILKLDEKDTIYIYEQRFNLEGVSYLRRGLIPLLRLEKERILVHEETKKKPKEDRKMLFGALKTFTSLIFGLYEDKKGEIEEVLLNSKKEEVFRFVDEDSIENRLFRMVDAREIDLLTNLMEEKSIYIADGHHRLDVSFEMGLQFIPLYLSNLYSDGLLIFPYHRVVKLPKDMEVLPIIRRASEFFEVKEYTFSDLGIFYELKKKLSSSAIPSFLFYEKRSPSNLYLVKVKTDIVDENIPPPLRKLNVNILHKGIFKKLGIEEENVYFFHEEKKALDLVKKNHFDFAIFLPPTKIEEVKDIADNHLFMPPKSTFFYPKIPAGILLYKYA